MHRGRAVHSLRQPVKPDPFEIGVVCALAEPKTTVTNTSLARAPVSTQVKGTPGMCVWMSRSRCSVTEPMNLSLVGSSLKCG